MRDQRVVVEVDRVASCAYVRFGDQPVARSVAHTEEINIDLDEYGMVVGIEVLDLAARMPFTALISEYHVDSAKVDLLRNICPTIPGFVARFHREGSLSPSPRPVPAT